jgi:hypothetical protein
MASFSSGFAPLDYCVAKRQQMQHFVVIFTHGIFEGISRE